MDYSQNKLLAHKFKTFENLNQSHESFSTTFRRIFLKLPRDWLPEKMGYIDSSEGFQCP